MEKQNGLEFLSFISGINKEKLDALYEEKEREAKENVKLISEADVIDAMAYATSKHMDFLTGMTTGSKICKTVVNKLFGKEDEA